MELRRLSDTMTVSGQISTDDISALKDQGVTTLIINRPDAETDADFTSEAIIAAAKDAGIATHYVPFVPGKMDDALVDDFASALTGAGHVHAYCKSGTRSTTLWAMCQAGSMPTQAILDSASGAGYDLSGVTALLDARARNHR